MKSPPRFKIKAGVQWSMMDERLEAAIADIARIWKEESGNDLYITSARDGVHSRLSLHYEGRAIDVRTWGLERAVLVRIKNRIHEEIQPIGAWDFVIEGDHVHIELDRRADRIA